MMTRRMMMTGLALAAAIGIGGTTASADFVYGIDNTGRILKVDTSSQTESVLYTPDSPVANGNGVALDLAGNRLLFRLPATGGLSALDLTTNTVSPVGLTVPLPGNASSGAFYDGAYWYVKQGTEDLVKVSLTGTPSLMIYSGVIGVAANYGDIAISSNGTLYGASSKGFFSLDVSGSTPSSYQMINKKTPVIQITMLTNGNLIGQATSTGQWYNVGFDGSTTPIDGFKTTGLNDIAGSTVPEPASVALMGLGIGAALAFARRRIKARA